MQEEGFRVLCICDIFYLRFPLLFYQIEPLKNGVSVILPSSIAKNS